MKLRTNYTKHDWLKLISTFAVLILVMGSGTVLSVHYFILPGVNIFTSSLKLMTKDHNAEKYGLYLKEDMAKLGFKNEQLLVSLLLMPIAVIVGLVLCFTMFIKLLGSIGIWITDKLKLTPTMRLVIIKNDKKWGQFP